MTKLTGSALIQNLSMAEIFGDQGNRVTTADSQDPIKHGTLIAINENWCLKE